MGDIRIRTLDRLDDLPVIDGLLQDYTRFICQDLERHAGIRFDPEVLISSTRNSLHKVIPPEGRSFVASKGDEPPFGMVFLRQSTASTMEIKRLYVRPEARGTGTGRTLVETAIAEARAMGANELRLDTGENLTGAIALYRDLGFVDCPPYAESDHFDDPVLGPYLVFMKLGL